MNEPPHHVKNVMASSTAAISYLGELCILLEPVLRTLVVLLGQMVRMRDV